MKPVEKKRQFVTRSGVIFDVLEPKPEKILIEDIAHGLSMDCRYGGQCKEFYSVAEHSVVLSYCVQDTTEARILLMHDATEAYLRDISRSLKILPMFDEYRRIEDHLYKAIMFKFNLPIEFPEHLKELDNRIVSTEKPLLFDTLPEYWDEIVEAYPPIAGVELNFWDHKTAKKAFLDRYKELFPV